jgi:VanZ family protein
MAYTSDHGRRGRQTSAALWGVLLAALLLFMVFGQVPDRTRFWEALYHAGHVPLFGLVAISILGLLRAGGVSLDRPRTWWLAFTLAILLGALTEILQLFQAGRDASFWHFLRDVAGAGSFLLAVATVGWKGGAGRLIRSARRRAVAWAAVVLMLSASGFNLAATTVMYGERDLAFPTLFALDGAWWERSFIETHDSVLTPHARPPHMAFGVDQPLARLDLQPGTYPGVAFDEPYPDWRGARCLVLTFVSDLEAPLPLTIRIHDVRHDNRFEDRFNRQLLIRPGFNRIVIPLDDVRRAPDRREMDMRHIRQIILFGYRLTLPTHVYLGPLYVAD